MALEKHQAPRVLRSELSSVDREYRVVRHAIESPCRKVILGGGIQLQSDGPWIQPYNYESCPPRLTRSGNRNLGVSQPSAVELYDGLKYAVRRAPSTWSNVG